jgi:hypothetical protein
MKCHALFASVAATVLAAAAGSAQGAELQGTIGMVDREGLAITVTDSGPDYLVHGLRLPRDVAIDLIREGANVRATYDEVEGTKVIATLEID